MTDKISLSGLLKIDHIIGNKKLGIEALIPVGKSTWWRWVADKDAPQPVKFKGTTFWRKDEIQAFIDEISCVDKDAA